MTATSWMKWYPGDWRADPLVGACSLESRYVWFEMLGIMHGTEPRGHLAIGGKAIAPETLAQMIRVPFAVVNDALVELEAVGVFSRNRAQIIYSRRMIRDEIRLAASAKGGKKGGKVSRDAQRGIFSTPEHTPPATPPKPPERNAESRVRGGQIPDTRSQKETTSSAAPSPPRELMPGIVAGARDAARRYDGWSVDLGDYLLDVAGLRDQVASAPNLLVMRPIIELLDQGHDLEVDIVAVIRAKARPGIGSWAWFVKAIIEAKAGATAGGAYRAQPGAGNANGQHAGGRSGRGPEEPDWLARIARYAAGKPWYDEILGMRQQAPLWVQDELDAIDKGAGRVPPERPVYADARRQDGSRPEAPLAGPRNAA